MTEDADAADGDSAPVDQDSGADVGHDADAERVTAPMSEYSIRAVAVGFAVLAVGLAVAFALPTLATL